MKFALKTENNRGPLVYVEINQKDSDKLLAGLSKTQGVIGIPVSLTLSNTDEKYTPTFGASNTRQLLGISIGYLTKEEKLIANNLTYSYSPENSESDDTHKQLLHNFEVIS